MIYPSYPNYNDSGVEWLEKIPSHWIVKAIKRLSPVQRGASPRPIDDPKYFDDTGDYAWVRIADVTSSKNNHLTNTTQRLSSLGSSLSVKLEPGSLFLSIAGSVGKACITTIKACIHDGFVYFPMLQENTKFLFYIFEGGEAYRGLGKLGTQLNLNTDTVGTIKVGVPPINEQQAIVQFLDHETERIDTLIAKQEQMITLLEEKRKAVISHAVTRGLDPQVPVKDSGIAWLGEIPAHWNTDKIKFCTTITGGGTPSKDNSEYWNGNIPWISPKDMKSSFIIDSEDHITQEALAESATKLIDKGSVLIVFRSGILKHSIPTAINMKPVTINQDLKAISPDKKKLLSDYFLYLIEGHQKIFLSEWSKIGSTVDSLETNLFNNTLIPLPTLNEQQLIVTYIHNQLKQFDTLITKTQRAIDLLHEHRSALISAAVTGKIDVRSVIGKVEEE